MILIAIGSEHRLSLAMYILKLKSVAVKLYGIVIEQFRNQPITICKSDEFSSKSFSVLKYIKSRLRSNLGQAKLESCMLMSSEKEILMMLDANSIITKVAEKSKSMQSLKSQIFEKCFQ